MAKHAAPTATARTLAALRRPSTEGEHATSRLTVVTLAAIFIGLLLLVGIGTANATSHQPATTGQHTMTATPSPARTGAGTSIPTTDELLGNAPATSCGDTCGTDAGPIG